MRYTVQDTVPIILYSLYKFWSNIVLVEHSRMRATTRPVYWCYAAIGDLIRKFNEHHGGDVVLVHIAIRLAKIAKLGIVLRVWHDEDGVFSTDFEPLGTFPPLLDCNFRLHVGVVSPSTKGPGIVKRTDKTGPGVDHMVVEHCEVEYWYATFWEKYKSLVWKVQQRVCQQPPLRIAHRHFTPSCFLQRISTQHQITATIRSIQKLPHWNQQALTWIENKSQFHTERKLCFQQIYNQSSV